LGTCQLQFLGDGELAVHIQFVAFSFVPAVSLTREAARPGSQHPRCGVRGAVAKGATGTGWQGLLLCRSGRRFEMVDARMTWAEWVQNVPAIAACMFLDGSLQFIGETTADMQCCAAYVYW